MNTLIESPSLIPSWEHLQKNHDGKSPIIYFESKDFSGGLSSFPGQSTPASHDPNVEQLRKCIRKMKGASSGTSHVDKAHDEYVKIKDKATILCRALLNPPSQHKDSFLISPTTTTSPSGFELHRDSSFDSASLAPSDNRSSTSASGLVEQTQRPPPYDELHLAAVRDWENCLGCLAMTLRKSLIETYNEHEPEATPAGFDEICSDMTARKYTISRMRSASISKMVSEDLGYFRRYDIRFRNYDQVKKDLNEMRCLLQAGESGISPERTITDCVISPRGDVVLGFANTASETYPVYRFRVASYALAETSPIFASMFNADCSGILEDEVSRGLPPPAPTRHICSDGSQTKLYRMPETELNTHGSLETLLHAAHLHNDKVPKEISFEQFVAIAEVCLRYQCTKPLELIVEHCWLPHWIQKATDEMPDGFLLISYVFGLRRIFTQVSKTAILNITDEADLRKKPWPQKIKNKIWAVRSAKMEQVYACCSNILQEYLRPSSESIFGLDNDNDSGVAATCNSRCPKGSRSCDASSLGWLMMILAELKILPRILPFPGLADLAPPPDRSLNQLVDSLRLMTSSPQSHGGVCDFAPAFRSAVNDVYNSVSGLTLFDISSKHGWALSRDKSHQPQPIFRLHEPGKPVGNLDHNSWQSGREAVQLSLLSLLDDLRDLHAAAMINRSFYKTYKENEIMLMRRILKRDSTRQTLHVSEWNGSSSKNNEEGRIEGCASSVDNAPRANKRQTATPYLDGSDNDDGPWRAVREDEDDQVPPWEARPGNHETPESILRANRAITREEAQQIVWSDRSRVFVLDNNDYL